jgi:hypothetical protein
MCLAVVIAVPGIDALRKHVTGRARQPAMKSPFCGCFARSSGVKTLPHFQPAAVQSTGAMLVNIGSEG